MYLVSFGFHGCRIVDALRYFSIIWLVISSLFLLYLAGYFFNYVVVWLFFQGKRGIEKRPFQLLDFIAATGIEKIRQVRVLYSRQFPHIFLYLVLTQGGANVKWSFWPLQAYIVKEDSKKLKQKQCEHMQPKMGKMDIDYQVPFYSGYIVLSLTTCMCFLIIASAVLSGFAWCIFQVVWFSLLGIL